MGLLLPHSITAAEELPKELPTLRPDRKVQPGDILLITVVDEPELTRIEQKVDPAGQIPFPYLENVDVKDKTTAEVAKAIRNGLDPDWIINPQVIVNVGSYVKKYVTVTGQVNNPGQIELPIDHKMTLVEAISSARDVTRLGSRKKIKLSRNGVIKNYDLDKLGRITDPEKQIYVEADDIITVGQGII